MTIDKNRTKDEAAIREFVDGFVKAIRAKDIQGVMSVFAPEVVSFDFGPPLQHGGGEEFMKRWQELFESYQNAIDYEVHDLTISASDDVAFSHSLNRVSGTLQMARGVIVGCAGPPVTVRAMASGSSFTNRSRFLLT